MYTNTWRNGKKEMTLESEKIRAIPMVHWCQWRPFLSPLTPVESICEYWTTLVQATCKSCYGTIQIIRKLTFTYSNVLSEIVTAGRFLCKLCTCGLCRWIATSESTLFIRACNFSRKPFFVVAQSTTSKQPLPMKTP